MPNAQNTNRPYNHCSPTHSQQALGLGALIVLCSGLLAGSTATAQPRLHPLTVGGCYCGNAARVAVLGNYAYLVEYGAGLQVIDVSNPITSVQVGGYKTSGQAVGVAVAGKYAYVAANDA